jgi:hypothetical protein
MSTFSIVFIYVLTQPPPNLNKGSLESVAFALLDVDFLFWWPAVPKFKFFWHLGVIISKDLSVSLQKRQYFYLLITERPILSDAVYSTQI